jgi:TetR/AcrR family transcriptional regulator
VENLASEKRILGTALEEFAKEGKGGARMQAIADQAEVNKSMLHYYFRSKDKLYDACLDKSLRDFHDAMSSALESSGKNSNPVDLLINTFFEFHNHNPNFLPFILREILSGAPTLKERTKRSGSDTGLGVICQVLGKVKVLQENGRIRSDIEPLQIMMTVIGSLASSVLQATTFSQLSGEDRHQILKKRGYALSKILSAGLSPQSKK